MLPSGAGREFQVDGPATAKLRGAYGRQNSPTTLEVEFSHILQWSSTNKRKLNTLKTKEIVFHRPRLPNRTLPHLFLGIERVSSCLLYTSDAADE